MMRYVLLACLLVQVSLAIVCDDSICDGVVQPALNCENGIIEKGGFCGCTDVCAQAKGDPCGLTFASRFLLMPGPAPECGDGLECSGGVCVPSS
ncbi:hypothetical protein ElyMa_005534300 [Elysia marginata]|uniref:Uncharacterized protein n=1 Tax=Elysia marginata TaxID=1093978 RepID=A0AAV4EYE5_9GAST|nr:hypothetical protein ElyMa_005534300 [Elysia marginata]